MATNQPSPPEAAALDSCSVDVVIRTFNSERTLLHCLASVRRQTVPTRIIAVDSGSTDGTLEILRQHAGEIVDVSSTPYTPGASLNRGMARVETQLALILSSHCRLESESYLESALELLGDDRVAGATGSDSHTGQAFWFETRWPSRPDITWGWSNHAAVVRTAAWQEAPFREGLIACEDKAWSADVHELGWSLAYSDRLRVSSAHRRAAGLRSLWRRARLEGQALAGILSTEPRPVRASMAQLAGNCPPTGTWRFLRAARRPSIVVEAVAFGSGLYASSRETDGTR